MFFIAAEDCHKLLKSVGVAAELSDLQTMIKAFNGRSTVEIIAQGRTQFASMPAGGSGGASSAPSNAGAAAKDAPKVEEKKKEEEVDMDMGDLFGGDY